MRTTETRGFTLIELLVVIAIIGVLSAVILSSLNTAREKARNASYVTQVKEYQKGLALHFTSTGSYPGNGTWGCIGIGFPGGVCWSSSSYTESNATVIAFRAALAPYMDATQIPGPSDRLYGPMYHTSGSGYQIIMMLEGEVSCPMGTKQVQATYVTYGVTRCDITI